MLLVCDEKNAWKDDISPIQNKPKGFILFEWIKGTQ